MGALDHGAGITVTSVSIGDPMGWCHPAKVENIFTRVSAFLTGSMSARSYVHTLARDAKPYNGFCLLTGDGKHLSFYSNRAEAPLEVPPGVHGLANHLLDTPWPKVVTGRARLEQLSASPSSLDDYLALLDDTVPVAERDLPQVGADTEPERRLSSLRKIGRAHV